MAEQRLAKKVTHKTPTGEVLEEYVDEGISTTPDKKKTNIPKPDTEAPRDNIPNPLSNLGALEKYGEGYQDIYQRGGEKKNSK